jgi:hypothetical protein
MDFMKKVMTPQSSFTNVYVYMILANGFYEKKKGQEFDIFWLEKKRGILVRSDVQPNMLQKR